MISQELKEKILFVLTMIALLSAGVFGYIFFTSPDSIFGLLFLLSGITLGLLTNLWCFVWGIEITQDHDGDFLDDYEPHKDIGVDPLNIYGTYDKP